MQYGKVVYNGKTKKGTDIIIRYPKSEDAQLLTNYINTLSKEQTFVRFQGEQMSLEDETNWLKNQIKLIDNNLGILLVVESAGTIIANSNVTMLANVESHIGLFGISVSLSYRGEGLGHLLMKSTIDEAIATLPQMKIVYLSVFANNPIAKSMYEKFGFVQYGTLPEGVLHRGEYVDHIYMYKKVR